MFGSIDEVAKSRKSLRWRSLSWERMRDFVYVILKKFVQNSKCGQTRCNFEICWKGGRGHGKRTVEKRYGTLLSVRHYTEVPSTPSAGEQGLRP